MGKRKVSKSQNAAKSRLSNFNEEQDKTKKDEQPKGKKTYSLQSKDTPSVDADDFQKVQISDKIESALIDLIIDHQKEQKDRGDISNRITVKKLTDVYNNLSNAGFSRTQVESSMSSIIPAGGDLIDALDWLCLNTQNDQLPSGFSETLQKEEEKLRPKFDVSLQKETMITKEQAISSVDSQKEIEETKDTGDKKQTQKQKSGDMKNWILQYAEQSSSDEEEDDLEHSNFDPTVRYSKLHDNLQELKDQAAIAKSVGATEKHKQLSKQLREIHLEMASLEKHPDFRAGVKEELKASSACAPVRKVPQENKEKKKDTEDVPELGFNLFEETIEKPPNQVNVSASKPAEDCRTFEYTRSQWTGKSPKQFLIDWVRKNLPKSPPPKFRKVQVKVNRFKSTAVVINQKGEELALTPEILCENIKDAEHLASTLMLYNLCKGQAVHQLLPPTYRNVWLEWQDQENQLKDEKKLQENKPRDHFITKLIKKLQAESSGSERKDASVSPSSSHTNDAEDDWETLADNLDEFDPFSEHKDVGNKVTPNSKQISSDKSEFLQSLLVKRRSSARYQQLLETRKQLPVFQYKDQVMASVRNHNVVVVAGETGSGKSTQIPQFVLEECIESGEANLNIICTEPRRISATSLSTRVSDELGESHEAVRNRLVGYRIRFESRHGPNTRLMYCTTGVVLRQLQNSVDLSGVSHLIIDEVHERSVQSDFLIVVVKNILSRRPDLKVILMSATLDSAKFSSYFNNCPVINIPGRTFPVLVYHLEDVIEMTGYVVDEDSQYTVNQKYLIREEKARVEVTQKGGESMKQNVSWTSENISRIDWTDLPADKYSLRTRNAVTRLNPSRINLDLICDLLKHLSASPEFEKVKGAVLIFLPGLSDIQELHEMLFTDRHFADPHRYRIYALHSVLSSEDQGKVFDVPPGNIRKIVIATNIAETGITIPDVVFVIDSGKVKENRYMETSQMSALEEVFISKANCKQRTGRAGRVQDGFCFRVFTKSQYKDMKAFSTPELLRVPLEELCLNIMKCQYGKPSEFLGQALDPPQSSAVTRAMSLLREVGACHSDQCSLTPLGHHLAALPVDVRIGKMLLLAAIFGCLDPISVIAAAMTDKSPFVVPLTKRSEADSAKHAMAVAASDHITLYKAYLGWKKARQEGNSSERTYLSKNFLKKSTLLDIENVKTDLTKLVASIGFKVEDISEERLRGAATMEDGVLKISTLPNNTTDLNTSTTNIIKAVLTAGLYPQAGKVVTTQSVDGQDKQLCLVDTAQGLSQVHPSSVNKFSTASGQWMIYHEKVRLSRVYLRDTTIVSPYALLLFGGDIEVQHTQKTISIDSWIKYKAVAKTGVIFKELRMLLTWMLQKKLQEPTLDISDSTLIRLLKDLVKSEKLR